MRSIIFFLTLVLFATGLPNEINAQQKMDVHEALDKKQQSIVSIAAFTATGNLVLLKKALNEGLDAGLTINESKEILVHLYAYTGFPRSLNAISTLETVTSERKQKGINDIEGKVSSTINFKKGRFEFGKAVQTQLTGANTIGAPQKFVPVIDTFLKEHLFSDIFGRSNLDWKTRELATIAALASLGNVEAQLRSHFNVGIYNGLTEVQLIQLVSIINNKIGAKEGNAASLLLQNMTEQNNGIKAVVKDSSTEIKKEMIIRISELEIHVGSMEQYIAILKEEAEASIRLEPGVIAIFPMYQKTNPQQVRILEIYANADAYKLHLTTPHFKKYKESTLHMVKSLQLTDMNAMDTETMMKIFNKQ